MGKGDELLYRTLQWQKSVGGEKLKRVVDIALAESKKGNIFQRFVNWLMEG